MTLIFGPKVVKILHDEVIKIRGVGGVKSEGMLEACLERPFTDAYGHEAYPSIFLKAGALLHSVIVFHPFIDGNKRTALLAVTLFMSLNGYSFTFPKDSVEFALSIAKLEIEDIETIARWIERSCAKNQLYGMDEENVLSMAKGISIPMPSGETIPLRLKKRSEILVRKIGRSVVGFYRIGGKTRPITARSDGYGFRLSRKTKTRFEGVKDLAELVALQDPIVDTIMTGKGGYEATLR